MITKIVKITDAQNHVLTVEKTGDKVSISITNTSGNILGVCEVSSEEAGVAFGYEMLGRP